MPKFCWSKKNIWSLVWSLIKFLLAVLLITVIMQPIIFIPSIFVSEYVHPLLPEIFRSPGTGGTIRDARRFSEFWLTALTIHFGYFVLDAFFSLLSKLKPLLCILGSSIITTTVAVTVAEMGAPTGWGGFLISLDYHIAYGFLFAMIMFSAYTLSTILFEKFTGIGKGKTMFLSFILSCIIGGAISYRVWRILIRHFFGI